MSIMVGVGRGARAGVLIKDAAALEQLAGIDTLVVDKTGTLTEGKPRLVAVLVGEDAEEDAVLRLAAGLERGSAHPLAAAVVAGAEARGLTVPNPTGFESLNGRGVRGEVDGRAVAVGNARLLEELSIDPGAWAERAAERRDAGEITFFVAVDDAVAGVLVVADPIRETTPAALAELREMGLRLVMLTGDSARTAAAVAKELRIDEVIADVLPEDKGAVIARLQREGARVAMAGDGVNDAVALSQAEVGIAMGTGADVAMESAGVTLVHGDLRGIVRARHLSVATVRNIRQNLGFAFGYNVLAIPIAAGVLYPAMGLLLSPMIASAAMSLSSVSVIANALRLRRLGL
jgi:Cu+-exporting ATPase